MHKKCLKGIKTIQLCECQIVMHWINPKSCQMVSFWNNIIDLRGDRNSLCAVLKTVLKSICNRTNSCMRLCDYRWNSCCLFKWIWKVTQTINPKWPKCIYKPNEKWCKLLFLTPYKLHKTMMSDLPFFTIHRAFSIL